MAYFINYCRQIVDVDKEQDLVEISYSKYIEVLGTKSLLIILKLKSLDLRMKLLCTVQTDLYVMNSF